MKLSQLLIQVLLSIAFSIQSSNIPSCNKKDWLNSQDRAEARSHISLRYEIYELRNSCSGRQQQAGAPQTRLEVEEEKNRGIVDI